MQSVLSPTTEQIRPRLDMQRCHVCNDVALRMHALMGLWFGALVEPAVHSGYFYLCPRCYARFITPFDQHILDHLHSCSSHWRRSARSEFGG